MQNKNCLRVLHVIPSLSLLRGGPSHAAIGMVTALRDANIDAEIVCSNDNGTSNLDVPLNRLTNYKGVPVRFFERRLSSFKVVSEFNYAKGFARWLKTNAQHYDVLHIHAIFSYCSSTAMRIARQQHIPYIVRPLGQLQAWSLTQSPIRKKLYLHLVERKNLALAASIHCTSDTELKEVTDSFPDFKVKMIPLGINKSRFHHGSREQILRQYHFHRDTNVLLSLSRIHPKKGLELLLSALTEMQDTPWDLVIAGHGKATYIDSLKQLGADLNIAHRCHYIGFVEGEDKQNLLQGADLFILSSYAENFGIAVIEAMAHGTPALVTNGVALSELIAENDLGYACKPKVDSIANTLNKALKEPAALEKKSQAARTYANKHFNWQAISKRLIKYYAHVSTTMPSKTP